MAGIHGLEPHDSLIELEKQNKCDDITTIEVASGKHDLPSGHHLRSDMGSRIASGIPVAIPAVASGARPQLLSEHCLIRPYSRTLKK